ncbi:cation diffusion facilitator family transporter [Solidesulfovibrio fructosivorans JJ]]|uniref:Cation diffusion facilitator family transporter n=1 Tax=Solidesulfovibrio fructosivorans JJ] TaxID=596151 RepID=E1JUN4_SOLFR|nr:cation diffusion facilitator family transporter [Solidesulfovibrio fructosivorans]EFL51798.1 cation diffusion facilitator family transporter [Solidesulfovibrio fructosivorans JJ]]
MPQPIPRKSGPEIRAARLSLGVAVILLCVKMAAWWLTGSAAIMSDALESIINVVAAGFAVVSVSVAATPPDEGHPYGHGNIEYYAAWLEGMLILLASVGIFYESWDKIFHPAPVPHLGGGIALLAGAGLVNLWLGLMLLREGRRAGSLTLVADGKHVLTDVYTSVGVLVGLGLVWATGWLWLDGAVACLVGINIAWAGVDLVRRSVSGFMIESDPELLEGICALLCENRHPAWIDIHRLRAIKTGRRVHVDMHLILPREMPLFEAHAQVDAVEALLHSYLGPDADIMIHADPCNDGRCSACDADPCDLRTAPASATPVWTPQTTGAPGAKGR